MGECPYCPQCFPLFNSPLRRYNWHVHPRSIFRSFFLLILLAAFLLPMSSVRALQPLARPAQSSTVSAYDLILATNTLRVSYGLPALIEDPIINAVAQSTANIMAANQMSWHIGNVSGRIQSAGYGGGAKVWATENFAVFSHPSIDSIMIAWSDAEHMRPVTNPAYCHVGAGIAKAANGMTYFVLQAAYISGQACGAYSAPSGGSAPPSSGGTGSVGVPGIIIPVKIATPDTEGKIFHVVEMGQSFWSIAVAYKITIHDIEVWNNISRDRKLQVGQKLFIPGENTEGYATPTPVGMILPSTPDPDGKIIHEIQSHQTLSRISQAYEVPIDRILALNGIKLEWPLQIGQKLLIHPGNVTPSPTPKPLTPVEKLTPESDGKYYHVVRSGQTLSWIADLYEILLFDLMSWNGLNLNSILQVDQKLVLNVTPPATETPTPGPATNTPLPSLTPTATATATPAPAPTENPTSIPVEPVSIFSGEGLEWGWFLGLGSLGLFVVAWIIRRRNKPAPEEGE
jgi:LysM repeat protein